MSPLLGFLVLAGLSVLATRVMIRLAVTDTPGGRKAHLRPTPTAGGVAVLVAVLAAPALLPPLRASHTLGVIAAALALGLFSLLDDIHPQPPIHKLAAQTIAAIAAITLIPTSLPPIAVLAWILLVTNAFNFMDGLDGLAPGTALLICLGVVVLAPADPASTSLLLALSAGLAGFLPHNIPRARIFLGDTGSQPIGFLLACLPILLPPSHAVLPSMLLAALLFDVTLTLALRARAGARLTQAHRDHLYQRAPLPARTVTLLHWGFVIWAAAIWLAPIGLVPTALALLLPQLAWLAFVRVRVRIST